jgi:hypothetical protein
MVQLSARQAFQQVKKTGVERVDVVPFLQPRDAQRPAARAPAIFAEVIAVQAGKRFDVVAIAALVNGQVREALPKRAVDPP